MTLYFNYLASRVVQGDIKKLPELVKEAEEVKQFIDNTVKVVINDMRTVGNDGGFTWQEIADALGVTRQAAWEKYHD